MAAAVKAFAQSARRRSRTVARRAHVGLGTLYRHSDAAALIEAAYRHEVVRLCAPMAGAVEDPRSRGGRCGRGWSVHPVRCVPSAQIDALRSVLSDDSALYAHTREQIVTALRSLLSERRRAARSVAMPSGRRVAGLAGRLAGTSEAQWQDKARRLLNLLMDGLATGRGNAPRAR